MILIELHPRPFESDAFSDSVRLGPQSRHAWSILHGLIIENGDGLVISATPFMAQLGHAAVVALWPLLGAEQKTYVPIELYLALTRWMN